MSARLSVTRQPGTKLAQIERAIIGDCIILVPSNQLGMGYFGVLNRDLIYLNNLFYVWLSLI